MYLIYGSSFPNPEKGIEMPKTQVFTKGIYYEADCLYMPNDEGYKYIQAFMNNNKDVEFDFFYHTKLSHICLKYHRVPHYETQSLNQTYLFDHLLVILNS
jgi:hypothetical protein